MVMIMLPHIAEGAGKLIKINDMSVCVFVCVCVCLCVYVCEGTCGHLRGRASQFICDYVWVCF